MAIIENGDVLLFQGDSITDCGRREAADGLGSGYPAIVAGLLPRLRPELKLTVLNRGIGGDRTAELLARWKTDCEDLKPSLLSIFIGVNDVWRILGKWCGQVYIGPDEYRDNYRRLLERAKAAGVRGLVLASPTAIDENRDAGLADLLDERAAIVRALAAEFGAVYVPFRESQARLLAERPDIRWTSDGCHPTAAGQAALAWTWLEATGLAVPEN